MSPSFSLTFALSSGSRLGVRNHSTKFDYGQALRLNSPESDIPWILRGISIKLVALFFMHKRLLLVFSALFGTSSQE
jgi:hypothetical protein